MEKQFVPRSLSITCEYEMISDEAVILLDLLITIYTLQIEKKTTTIALSFVHRKLTRERGRRLRPENDAKHLINERSVFSESHATKAP
jgi:hypothetical protein